MKINHIFQRSMRMAAAVAAALTMTFQSCDFLERQPYDKVDPTVEVTDDIALAMANACYRTLPISPRFLTTEWRFICGAHHG